MGFYSQTSTTGPVVANEKSRGEAFGRIHCRNPRLHHPKTTAGKGLCAVGSATCAPDAPLYGYRHLSTELGRWPSRDPIGEQGGLNVYIIANNNTQNQIDLFGLWPCTIEEWEAGICYGAPEEEWPPEPAPPNTGGLPPLSLDVSVGYAAQLCAPVGGSWGLVVSADVTISSGTCCGVNGLVGYTTVSGTFSASLYAGVCNASYGPKKAVSLGLSDSCPAENPGAWSGAFNVSGNASIATYSCSFGWSGGWSCSAGTDFSRATSAMVTIGGSLVYSRTTLN